METEPLTYITNTLYSICPEAQLAGLLELATAPDMSEKEMLHAAHKVLLRDAPEVVGHISYLFDIGLNKYYAIKHTRNGGEYCTDISDKLQQHIHDAYVQFCENHNN